MLLGTDYAFWDTFWDRQLFPKLGDALKVFPSIQIYNRILTDWPTLRNEIGPHLFAQPDLMRKIETLYGAYLLALKAGAKPYEAKDKAATAKFPTASYMVSQTGISRGVVVAFLTTLEKMAKAGTISQKYWAPDRAIAQNKVIVQKQKEYESTKPKGPLEELATTGKWIGLAALGVFALGAAVYLKPLRRG